jgi:ribosomal protein L11 methyltransferase
VSVLAVRIVPRGNYDDVLAALFEAGSEGVHEDAGALVTSLADRDIERMRQLVSAADPLADISVAAAPQTDFSGWRGTVGAHTVGRITVAPPWVEVDAADHLILIEPAMAFGTGEHETTRLCLSLLQRVIRPGDAVADLGSGSAVLAIAAARLGARAVAAIEIDPDATSNAEDNVARNGVAGAVHLLEGDASVLLPLVAPVRVVIANILSSVISGMLPTIADALTADGEAVLSGIMLSERDSMSRVLVDAGWVITAEESEGEWWSAVVARARSADTVS